MNRLISSSLVIALLAASSAIAQTNDPAAVQAVLQKARDKYGSLKTYQDRVTVRFEMAAKDADGKDASRSSKKSGSLAFAAPNRIALVSDNLSIFCDGIHLRACLPPYNQYTESAAPATLDLRSVTPMQMFMMIQLHPVALMLAEPQADFQDWFPTVKDLTGIAAETRNGEPGHRLFGKLGEDLGDPDQPVPVISFWFSDVTGLLGEMRIDLTEVARHSVAHSPQYDEDNKPPRIEKEQIVLSVHDVVLDGKIAPVRFDLEPDASSQKVDELAWPAPDESKQMELVGKPAPEISGTGLDGKPVSLAALRGQVVVLDFWATWCGPCVMAIPHVQNIASNYAGKPVTVLGINRDEKGAGERVKKSLDRKKITFRQLLDPAGEVSGRYQVNGIPCTVLIGANGIIQAIHVGFGGEEEEEDQIDSLLRGGTLIVTNTAAAVSGSASNATASTVLIEISPDRLGASTAPGIQVNGLNSRRIDLDGDGRQELALLDWQGVLRIVSLDGALLKTVRFKGQNSGVTSRVSTFELVRKAKTLQWLVGFTNFGGLGSQTAGVGLYSIDGEPIWTYQPAIAGGACSQVNGLCAGDLAGDGKIEMVAAMNLYNARRMDTHTWQQTNAKGYLVVLDGSGNCLALRRSGQRAEVLAFSPGAHPGEPGSILCSVDGRLRRFQWSALSSQPK